MLNSDDIMFLYVKESYITKYIAKVLTFVAMYFTKFDKRLLEVYFISILLK